MHAGERAELKAQQLEAAVEEARQRLAQAEQRLQAWRQGAEGERRTGAVLAALEPQGWAVLHDLHWPGRPYANIDHIAVGPTGVHVIDSKHWSGRIEVRQGVLRQNGYSRESDCQGVASATAAVAAFLEPQHRSSTAAVLCLVGQPTPVEQPTSVRVVGLDDLVRSVTEGAPRLTAADVSRIAAYLRGLLDGSRSPDQRTTAVLDSLGAAPVEAGPRRRRHLPAATTARAGHSSRKPARRRPSSGRRLVVATLQVALVAVMGLYVAPRAFQALADSFAPSTPRPTPTVVTPHRPATTATARAHVTPRSTSSGR